jgi:hypothetical protein
MQAFHSKLPSAQVNPAKASRDATSKLANYLSIVHDHLRANANDKFILCKWGILDHELHIAKTPSNHPQIPQGCADDLLE